MKITASRLSEGNKLFPSEMHIEPNGLTVKIPGFFSGQSRHLDYQNIGEVSVDTPLVGYSTITFFTAGTRVSAHGFTSSEVKQIKFAIEKGKTGFTTGANTHSVKQKKTGEQIIAKAEAQKIAYELEQQRKHDNSIKPWLNDSNFDDKLSINNISFPNDIEDIEKTVEKIIKSAIEKIRTTINENEKGLGSARIGEKKFLKPYYEEFDFVEICFEKATEGIKRLKRKDEFENPKLKVIINDIEDVLCELKDRWLPKLIEKNKKEKKKNLTFWALCC